MRQKSISVLITFYGEDGKQNEAHFSSSDQLTEITGKLYPLDMDLVHDVVKMVRDYAKKKGLHAQQEQTDDRPEA